LTHTVYAQPGKMKCTINIPISVKIHLNLARSTQSSLQTKSNLP